MKKISIALAVLGLLGGTLLIAWFGLAHVVDAALSVGWDGFAALAAWQLLLLVVLGLAWRTVGSDGRERAGVFVWGRMVRDAATNCLPFSPVGGYVFGTRALTLHGVAWPLATASVVVDVTAELAAQMAFTLLGLGILVAHDPHSVLALPVAIGLAVAVGTMAAFVWVQRGAGSLFAGLARRLAAGWFADAHDRLALLRDAIDRMYARAGRLALAVALHLAGWLGTAGVTWLAYRLLGAELGFADAVAIEALLRAVLAVAFVVPAAAGVQEAGYAGFGALFGVPPDVSLGVSLLARARDLAIGVPVLLAWQWIEVRRLRDPRPTRSSAG